MTTQSHPGFSRGGDTTPSATRDSGLATHDPRLSTPDSRLPDSRLPDFSTIEKIANAVLYEGYMLYPYRSSAIKNQQRWNFGTLYPASFAAQQRPAEQSRMITECLVNGGPDAALDVCVRFLQLARRHGQAVPGQTAEWEEGFEKFADFSCKIDDLIAQTRAFPLKFDETESPDQQDISAFFRQKAMQGSLKIHAENVQKDLYKLHFELENSTEINPKSPRADAMLQSFVSAHLLLATHDAQLVSLLEPPADFTQAASECSNIGAFPVLISATGAGTTAGMGHRMLSSPIILYDYPQIAPESAGDFFDSTEMDEMLALRVMTLTDEEKEEMRGGDSRARAILARTESLPAEHLMKVHGAVRGMRKIRD